MSVAGVTQKKKPPDLSGGFLYSETICQSYGAGALPRSPQVKVVGAVGAAAGAVSQYMRDSNASAPCAVIAALRFVALTETSVVEYIRRRGILALLASAPGEIVYGTQVRRHSAHAVPPSPNSASHFCCPILTSPGVPGT